MKKIISLFQRNYDDDCLVRDEVVPGAEWVANGEGVATQKYDGTCCLIKDGELYARYDVKEGRIPPDGFIPAQDPDLITGHWPGWVKCDRGDKQWRWHFEALSNMHYCILPDGTYELCGSKINKNPEEFEGHLLVPHNQARKLYDAPRTFDELKKQFVGKDIEGIVWHHPDGRMVKIKKKDFGLKRKD